jgi:hypothetical protein
MFEQVKDVMEQSALHLGAIAFLWLFLVVAGFVITRWCIKQEISWQGVIRWISIIMSIVFALVVLMYLLPQRFSVPITKVLVPNLICAIVLHALLLSVDRYMRHRYSEGIIQTRLVLAIITIYICSISASVGLIKIHYLTLMRFSDILIGYLTRIALLGLLILEVLAGRCKDRSTQEAITNDTYTQRW